MLNIAEVLTKLAAPLFVLSIQYLHGFERVSFNQWWVASLSLKLNGQCLSGKAERPVIPSVLQLWEAPSPHFDFMPYTESLRVIAWFWALGFCLVLCTCFLLEIHACCICWHPVSKWWRGTACWASFCSERGATTHGRLLSQWSIVRTMFAKYLWNGKYFVVFKQTNKQQKPTPKLLYVSLWKWAK